MSRYPTDREQEWSTEDYELAFEKTCEDVELWSEWICGHRTADFDERQSSTYWGPISSNALIELLLKGNANAEQKVAIVDELQARWERDMREVVEAQAKKNASEREDDYAGSLQDHWDNKRKYGSYA